LVQQKKIEEQKSVQLLFRVEMAISCLTALCMILLWSPVVDGLTNGKYGAVNALPVFYLAATLPVLYLNNFLWSIHFSNGRFRFIFYSFALCFTVNLLSNLVLIPLLQTSGAALSYLISLTAQSWIYTRGLGKQSSFDWQPFFVCSLCALAVGTACRLLPFASWQTLPIGVCCYLLLLFITVQIRKTDFQNLKQVMSS
jgi:O-antigen/teichoic acid export membrane protein